jgi:hypothetical protein
VSFVSLSEALAGLVTLTLYEEQQEDGSRDLVRTLNRLDRELRGKRANQGAQKQVDSCFRPWLVIPYYYDIRNITIENS